MDAAYFAKRLDEEKVRAEAATNSEARRAHLGMVHAYRKLLDDWAQAGGRAPHVARSGSYLGDLPSQLQ